MRRGGRLRLLLLASLAAGGVTTTAQAQAEVDALGVAARVTNPGVRIAGITPARSLDDDTVAATPQAAATARALAPQGRTAPAPVGQHSVLVLRVRYADEGAPPTTTLDAGPYSAAELRDRITASTGSAGALYAEQSGGTLGLKGRTSPAADVAPWFELTGNFPVNAEGTCDADAARDEAEAEADRQLIPWRAYDHVVMVFPPLPSSVCSWSGLGQIAGNFSWINGLYSAPESEKQIDAAVIAHEIGHNLGVGHAASLGCTQQSGSDPLVAILPSTQCTLPTSSTDPAPALPMVEYGDPFDMMGTFSYRFPWRGTELMSTWRRARLLQLPAASQQTVTADGTYALHAASASMGVRLLRLPRPGGSLAMSELALEYRPAGDTFDRWDLDPDPAPGGVLVHVAPSTTSGFTYLLDGSPATHQEYATAGADPDAFEAEFRAAWRDAALQPGHTLVDAEAGISVRVVSIVGDVANVEVRSRAPETPAPTPSPTPTPEPTVEPTPEPTPVSTDGPSGRGSGQPLSDPLAPGVGPSPGARVTPVPTPLANPSLVWPLARDGVRKLASTRKIIVSFPGASRISIRYGKSWARGVRGSNATFILPKAVVRKATLQLRATGPALRAPWVAHLRIRNGVLALRLGA